MKTKAFDCVEMKREGAELVQSETSGMTPEQEQAYWDEAYERLLALQRRARQRAKEDADG